MSDGADNTATIDLDGSLDSFADTFFGKETDSKEVVQSEDSIADAEADIEVAEEAVQEAEAELDEADDESHESEEDDDGRQEEPVKNKKSAKERINEITREKYEAERRELETQRKLVELEAEILKLRNPQPEVKAEPVVVDNGPDPEAKNEDGTAKYPMGEFDPKYIQDLTRFTLKQEREAAEAYRKEAEAEQAVVNARNEAQAKFTERLVEAEAEDPNIRSKILSLDPVMQGVEHNYAQYLVDIVRGLDAGPRVLAYLADNPDTARSIVNSGAVQATIALGRLDAQLQRKPKAEPKKVSEAPTPPVQVRGTKGGNAVRGDTESLDDFERVFFKPKKR